MIGIAAAKVLAENGVDDVVILEAADRIGGRLRKEEFGGVNVELGAGWIAGVGGQQSNPIWELASHSDLRTCFSDYSFAPYNIYDQRFVNFALSISSSVHDYNRRFYLFIYFCSGKKYPIAIAADSYQKAVDSAIQKLNSREDSHCITADPETMQ